MDPAAPITTLLKSARDGDAGAAEAVYRSLYAQLRGMARQRSRQLGALAPLDATELLHESFLRLNAADGPAFESRQHFLAYASRVMRNVLVDLVRERQAERRGGSAEHTVLSTQHGELPDERHDHEMLALDNALESLRATDARLAQVVELRYFAGLSHADIAAVMALTERTVQRDWAKARLLLRDLIRD